MNLNQLKTPVICFMAGYIFQYVDHYHKSILAHGYSLALLAIGVYVVLMLGNKMNNKITHLERKQSPRMLSADTVEQQGHTINVGQAQRVR